MTSQIFIFNPPKLYCPDLAFCCRKGVNCLIPDPFRTYRPITQEHLKWLVIIRLSGGEAGSFLSPDSASLESCPWALPSASRADFSGLITAGVFPSGQSCGKSWGGTQGRLSGAMHSWCEGGALSQTSTPPSPQIKARGWPDRRALQNGPLSSLPTKHLPPHPPAY